VLIATPVAVVPKALTKPEAVPSVNKPFKARTLLAGKTVLATVAFGETAWKLIVEAEPVPETPANPGVVVPV